MTLPVRLHAPGARAGVLEVPPFSPRQPGKHGVCFARAGPRPLHLKSMHSDDRMPSLGVPGFTFHDLRSPERLRDLFDAWESGLAAADPSLQARYAAWRATGGTSLPAVELSDLLVEVAPHVSQFVARLFGVTAEHEAERERTRQDLAIFRFKDEFVKRRALKRAAPPSDSPAEHAAVQQG